MMKRRNNRINYKARAAKIRRLIVGLVFAGVLS
jgi:tetrahydromethanopterin S-methyltransferase subunit F